MKLNQWFFEKIKKNLISLNQVIKKQRQRTQVNKIGNEKRHFNRHHRNTKDHKRQLQKRYAYKMDSLESRQTLRNTQPSKTEPGKNRKYKETNQKQ